ncbi:hypothetical protein TanjilG_01255 [Lupinus angustifolius]|uniref:Ubiquitin-like domain-containing protein n=1 Tax=Lupinus angustifolius TaxID=3871 RepID=A0A4P1REF2_LUPAN|nr:PREDICTED: uncharacterized protein LOC109350735 isoform X2 [Lupinus angustifolius]OIW09284.1 hypothetical protein TanjilG_01255 [Lupinus angustifolius]
MCEREGEARICYSYFNNLNSFSSSRIMMNALFSSSSSSSSSLYHKLRPQPLTLSVLKLDGSSFHIQVPKTATVSQLKDSVEAVFTHNATPNISWPHVWAQFCLCYDGQKLVNEEDYLRNYGIKDGDQLRFIRHVSNSYNVRRKRLKKRVVISKKHRRSSSQVNSYQSKDHSDDADEVCSDDIATESGKIQLYNEDEQRAGKKKLTEFVGVLFSSPRLAVVKRTRIESKLFCPSMIAKCLMGSFGKIKRIICFGRRRHDFQKHILRQY